MAEMEKITFQPLVSHIRDRSDYYNKLYLENELKYSQIDRSLISIWMVNTIEPIAESVHLFNPDYLPPVFKALYIELLKILGNKTGILNENEYLSAWAIFNKNPELIGKSPVRLINAVDCAIESIRSFIPEKVTLWISSMDGIIADCRTTDDFLACGRIYAWLYGMAHLRSRAEKEYNNLSSSLKQIISRNPFTNDLDSAFQANWSGLQYPCFVGEIGGFVGFGGMFTAPPLLAQIDKEIVVTDKNSCCLFFADRFGKVLLPDIPYVPDKIVRKSNTNDLKTFKSIHGKKLVPFDDVSSCVLKESTLVLTRASSHYLYVYGWPL